MEDNDGDFMLIKLALQTHAVPHRLSRAADGAQAVDMIRSFGQPSGFTRPGLVLLDLNLPKVDGPHVLAEFRKCKICGDTPVIVMSSASASVGRALVSSLGISHYFQKPPNLDEFMRLGELVAPFALAWRECES